MLSTLAITLFLQAAPATIGTGQSPTTEAPPTTRTLRLSDAVDTALKNQPSLAQSRAQTEAARGRATQARQLYYPQVTLSASYQRVRSASIGGRGTVTTQTSSTGTGTTGTGTGTDTTGAGTTTSGSGVPTAIGSTDSAGIDVFTFGGTASWLIWDWGNTYHKVQGADRNVESFQANEKVSAQVVVVDVRHAYFAARAQKALVQVARESLQNFQRHLDQIQGFVQVGTRPEIDLAQARTDVANARLSLINADNAYATSKAQLARTIGLQDQSDFDVSDDELGPVDGEAAATGDLTSRALKARPELVLYDKQREANELIAKGYQGAYLPYLSASAGASETGTDLGDLGPAWNVGVSLTWPIFQGWLTHGQIHEAQANADAARAQGEGEKLQIRLDVEQAQLGIRAGKASQQASGEALFNARERLRLAEGRYASGVGSIIELGDAQLAVTTAAAQVVQANFNLSSARADLLAALGQR